MDQYLVTHAKNATPADYKVIREGIPKFGSGLAKQAIDDVINKSGVKCFTPNNANILMCNHPNSADLISTKNRTRLFVRFVVVWKHLLDLLRRGVVV